MYYYTSLFARRSAAAAVRTAGLRSFSAQPRLQKTATETVKDAAKAVDRTISDAAVKGIEKGGQYCHSLV